MGKKDGSLTTSVLILITGNKDLTLYVVAAI